MKSPPRAFDRHHGTAFRTLSPRLWGEGRGEGACPRTQTLRIVERPPHPALRADLSPQAGRGGERRTALPDAIVLGTSARAGSSSTAGQRIFDQVVDVVEGDLVDRPLDLEKTRWLVLEDCHDGRFDRRTARLDAWDLLDDDRRVIRKSEILPHPVPDLIEGKRRHLHVAAKRIQRHR